MKNLKLFLTTFLITILLIVATSITFATEANPSFIKDDGDNTVVNNTNTNDLYNNTTNNATNNNVANTTNDTTNNTVNNTNNSNTSVYNNTDLPKAGSSDGIVIIAIIAVFGISALYAYKKIREYNV